MFSRQEPWYGDGDIVLVCHDAGFRVHLDVLAAQSNVFRHMAEMPKPREECCEMFDQAPVVRLQDTVEDIRCFLHSIYEMRCSSTVLTCPNFASASSLLRLGTKYDAPLVRQHAIDVFTSLYPSTSDTWARRDIIRQFPPFRGELSLTLTLAIEHDVESLIPSILYAACKLPLPEATSELLSLSVHPATIQDLYGRFLRGRQALHRAELQALLSYLSPSFTQPKCRGLKSDARCCAANPFKVHPSSGLCVVCCDLIDKSIQERSEEIWQRVPGLFGFASWETLKERDKLSVG